MRRARFSANRDDAPLVRTADMPHAHARFAFVAAALLAFGCASTHEAADERARSGGHAAPSSAPAGDRAHDTERSTAPHAPGLAAGSSAAPDAAAPRIDPSILEPLRAALVHVQPLDPASGLLWVDCVAATALEDAQLAALLAPIGARVAHLGLERTHAGATTLAMVARMPELQRLDLRGTRVDTGAFAALAGHPKLSTLVVAQTKLDANAADVLLTLPALTELFTWRSGLDAKALERLRAARPKLAIDAGDGGPAKPVEVESDVTFVSGRALSSSAPTATTTPAGGKTLEPVNATCPVSGTPVNSAFSIVFEGRVIGFCCSNCPTKFWADPQSYKSKLPQ
ncbi:MAG: hypothetical protein IPJ77_24690 [Planctomycetes bacterium]|nr:hypothetical protein [Planctomycetota bacterium]